VPETSPGLIALSTNVEKRVQSGVTAAFGLIAEAVSPLLEAATSPRDLAHRITMDWPVTYREATSLVDALTTAVGIPTRFYLKTVPAIPGDVSALRLQQGRWARAHAADMVTNLSQQTQQTLARSLQRSLNEYAPIDVTAMRLRRYIGLDDRYAQAVDNYRDNLLAKGTKPTTANRLSRSYASRLRTSRARTIAQTETTRALWEGQRQYWDQLQADGVVDAADMRKRWRTHRDERVCPVCRPLHGVTIPWDDKWLLPGGAYVMGPPGHPNCRCEVTVLWSRYVVSKHDELLAKALGRVS